MRMRTKEEFFAEIEEATEVLRGDLYLRLVRINQGLIEKKIAACENDHVFGFKSLASDLEFINLPAPIFYAINDDNNEILGWISLPRDLKDFLQTFCLGSTHVAYHILRECSADVRKFPFLDVRIPKNVRKVEPVRKVKQIRSVNKVKKAKKVRMLNMVRKPNLIRKKFNRIQPFINFINIVDKIYNFHIGRNPKYIDRSRRNANISQLKYSQIYTASGSIEDIKNRFFENSQKKFDNEPLPLAVYSLGPMLDGYCQYCHRPNNINRRYCEDHKPDIKGNNSKSNSITNAYKKAFRNFGLCLHDEEGFKQKDPDNYILLAEKKRNDATQNKNVRLQNVQNDIKSEYFIRLEGWAKHNPIYLSFYGKISGVCLEYNENLILTKWENAEAIELISKILDICRGQIYIDPKRIPGDISSLTPVEIKSALLGKYGLDIKPELHPNIEVDHWITMLCRHFQQQLILACKNEKVAKDLDYIK